MFRKTLYIIIVLVALFSFTSVSLAKKSDNTSYSEHRKLKGKNYCSYNETKGKWVYTKLKKSTYRKVKKTKAIKRNKKKLRAFKKNTKNCKKQISSDAISFNSLPSAQDFLIPNDSETTAVSGTPPTIAEITNATALTTFWREVEGTNVIAALREGSPSTAQCGEFYGGDSDGESGGLVACEANIDALRALVKPMEAGVASCYLKNIATQDAVDGGAISLQGGSSFPNGHVANLYAPPSGSGSRVVKMVVSGGEGEGSQIIYVEVPGAGANAGNDRQYHVNLWFCDEGQTDDTPSGVDQISVGTDNSYSASSVGLRDGRISISLNGSVVSDGDDGYTFDPSQPAEGLITFIDEGEEEEGEEETKAGSVNSFDITVADGIITLLKHSIESTETTKGIAKISYQGSIDTLQMFEGAGSFRQFQNDVLAISGVNAFEYRDGEYLTTTESDLLTAVLSEDFTGSFFTTTPSVTLDTEGFSCSAAADVTIAIDMTSDFMQSVESSCSSFIPENTRFCETEALTEAEESYETNCSQ